jgi:hypothetical protein
MNSLAIKVALSAVLAGTPMAGFAQTRSGAEIQGWGDIHQRDLTLLTGPYLTSPASPPTSPMPNQEWVFIRKTGKPGLLPTVQPPAPGPAPAQPTAPLQYQLIPSPQATRYSGRRNFVPIAPLQYQLIAPPTSRTESGATPATSGPAPAVHPGAQPRETAPPAAPAGAPGQPGAVLFGDPSLRISPLLPSGPQQPWKHPPRFPDDPIRHDGHRLQTPGRSAR